MSARTLDLTGKKYGDLTVLRRSASSGYMKRGYWTCACKCGNEIDVFFMNLTHRKSYSCGCAPAADLRRHIEDRSIPIPFAGCWLWLAAFFNHGYAQTFVSGEKDRLAHRVSYRGFKGEIPDGMLIQHSCDNPWCVCPDHLSLGTDKTNAVDMQRKGRIAHRLSKEQVLEIREARKNGETHDSIAARFGVSSGYVSMIGNRLAWSHV